MTARAAGQPTIVEMLMGLALIRMPLVDAVKSGMPRASKEANRAKAVSYLGGEQ
jgi:hypothetical protein